MSLHRKGVGLDSLTQIALGSAIGYAVMGRQMGKRAALYGAILGTVPDLDVFINYGGDVQNFTYHRGFSHSFIVHAVISPLFAYMLLRFERIFTANLTSSGIALPSKKQSFMQCTLMVFLVLVTHALIDGFTVYGTQYLWPITEYPFAFSTLFIIDPLYTIPLLVLLVMFFIPNVNSATLSKTCSAALIISTVYLGWSVVAKWHIEQINNEAFARANITSDIMISSSAPMTTLLWRSVVMQDDHYYEVFTSVFDSPEDVSITRYETKPSLLDNIKDEWEVQRLIWFTKGAYSVRQVDDRIILSDLRMGMEGAYVFSFEVGLINQDGYIRASDFTQESSRPDISALLKVFKRVTDPTIKLSR